MGETNVVVLGNHGLVVAGQTVAEVDDRIESVCASFSAPARSAPPADIEKLAAIAAGGDYRVPEDPAAQAVALDPINLATARQGSLYPDHVVFLGPGLVEATVKNGRLNAPVESPRPPLMLALPGLGVLLHRSVSRGADAMARCLADVAARIPEDASIRTLTAADERQLLDWEAETYRQSLAMPASVIGIDVGTSGVRAAALADDGVLGARKNLCSGAGPDDAASAGRHPYAAPGGLDRGKAQRKISTAATRTTP